MPCVANFGDGESKPYMLKNEAMQHETAEAGAQRQELRETPSSSGKALVETERPI